MKDMAINSSQILITGAVVFVITLALATTDYTLVKSDGVVRTICQM